MYLDQKRKNSFTIGKELRKIKQLRKKDTEAKLLPLTPELSEYKKSLEQKGLQIGPLEVAIFQTKNGLKYPGFIAKETIKANNILLRVPVNCLLTTRDAFLSEIQKVFLENPHFYSKSFSSDWQDRIILTYLLYEYQKGNKSQWYHLLQNLPRDIDYVAFWEESEFQILEDSWVVRSIKKQKERVLQEQSQLIRIAKKYPQFFDLKIFTPQNITWIHVHLVTRCFGKYFQYTTMVPYAELFNHQCVDVYYTMDYRKDNPHNPNEELSEPRFLDPNQEEEADTSDGSYNASDVSCDDQDFEERELLEPKINASQSIISEIKTLNTYLIAFINFNDEVSLPYLQKTYTEMQNLSKLQQKEAMQRLVKVHSKNVKYLKMVKEFYFKLKSNRYTYGLKQRKIWKNKQNKNKVEEVDSNCNYFERQWPKDKFDDFLMVCGPKDQFQQGSQVYFCYGRLPNRLLLMRYGIALEHNKYNHVFIRLDVSDLVYKSLPLQRAVQQQIALKKYKRFKLKRTSFCNELLTYHRCLYWKYEEDPQQIFYVYNIEREAFILQQVRQLLQKKVQQYSCSVQQNQKKLTDKNIGYHQYFAIVYRLEQQRIFMLQIEMIDYALNLIGKMMKGQVLEKLLREEKEEKKLRLQIMMEPYLRSFRYF